MLFFLYKKSCNKCMNKWSLHYIKNFPNRHPYKIPDHLYKNMVFLIIHLSITIPNYNYIYYQKYI